MAKAGCFIIVIPLNFSTKLFATFSMFSLGKFEVWISQKSQEKLSKQNGASSDRVSEEYKAEAKEAKP
ncbi:hypothetical protein Tco_0728604 [Tanacetum coccineum]|uniref:Uncharacterized protein n=1 Tax=Tanacetum coccineum TaxID=301880 RepID=A0ABQ4YPN8_9ASTR